MTVVVHPESATADGGAISLHKEVQTIRAAVLYADEIEVVSPATEMLTGVKSFAEASASPALDVLRSLDPETLEMLGSADGGEMKKMLDLLPVLQDPAFESMLAGVDDESVQEFRRVSAGFKETMAQSTSAIRESFTAMYEAAGGPELSAATKSGIVRLKPLFRTGDDWDADTLVERYADAITGLLKDGSRHMLLDEGTASLARNLIREKRVEPSTLALPNALESIIGTGVVARLPTFGETPTDELLDLRRDLIGPLSRYRRAVASLGERMRVGALDSEAEAELDHLFRTEIEPALDEMRELLAEHGLVREFARAVGADLRAVVTGGAVTSGLVVAAQAATDLAAVATAGLAALPGMAASGSVLFKARQAQQDALGKVKGRDLYYLHELDKRMA